MDSDLTWRDDIGRGAEEFGGAAEVIAGPQ